MVNSSLRRPAISWGEPWHLGGPGTLDSHEELTQPVNFDISVKEPVMGQTCRWLSQERILER